MVQLPALNTPQFDWVRSRLPGRAQPVPPIFQPEVAADAIAWAALHAPREAYVALPTIAAAFGNAIAPGLADRLLARAGYDAQQTDQLEDPDRPHNLWSPVDADRDFGTHGRFDALSLDDSLEWRLRVHRRAAGLVLAAAGLLALAASRRR